MGRLAGRVGGAAPRPALSAGDDRREPAGAATSGTSVTPAGAGGPAGGGDRGGPQRIPRPPGVRPGPGAWWSRPGATPPATVGLEAVLAAFAGGRGASDGPPAATTERGARGQVDLPGSDARPAAVLCALFDDGGDVAVVLTRRSATLRSHTGEVSFPGGRLDPGETPLAAALREAEEEIGLDPGGVEIIGTLRPLSTSSSSSLITPFVGVLPGRPQLRRNAAEVARVFTVTLAELVAPGTYHEEIWEREGGAFGVHFFEVPGETVWGATARMLRDLLDRVLPAPH